MGKDYLIEFSPIHYFSINKVLKSNLIHSKMAFFEKIMKFFC